MTTRVEKQPPLHEILEQEVVIEANGKKSKGHLKIEHFSQNQRLKRALKNLVSMAQFRQNGSKIKHKTQSCVREETRQ